MYLLTSPHANMIGYYYLPIAYAQHDLQYPTDTVSILLRDLCTKAKVAYDFDAEVVLIKDYLDENQIKGEKQYKGAKTAATQVPPSVLLTEFVKHASLYCPEMKGEWQGLLIPHQYPIQYPIGTVANTGTGSGTDTGSDKDIDNNKEHDDAPPESGETSPLGEIEQYLQGRTQSALLSGFDMTAVLDWVKRTDGNVQIVKDGIDAGLKIFQRDNPDQVPRSAKFYSGYVEKAWSRHKVGGAGDGRTTGRPRDADPQATGPGAGQGGAPAAGTPNPLTGTGAQTGAGKPGGPSGAGRQPSFNSLSQ